MLDSTIVFNNKGQQGHEDELQYETETSGPSSPGDTGFKKLLFSRAKFR